MGLDHSEVQTVPPTLRRIPSEISFDSSVAKEVPTRHCPLMQVLPCDIVAIGEHKPPINRNFTNNINFLHYENIAANVKFDLTVGVFQEKTHFGGSHKIMK
jgi:hypothetical protein